MKKTIFTLLMLLSLGVHAQKSNTEDNTYKLTKKSWTVSLLLGSGTFIEGSDLVFSNNNIVSGSSPSLNYINNGNSLVNMVGAEGKYFVDNDLAITLTGGASFRNTPASLNIPEIKNNLGATLVPAYEAVVGLDQIHAYLAPGLQWYFTNKRSSKLLPYLGFAIPFNYARTSSYDPTITPGSANPVSYGLNHVEAFGIGAQGVAGLDYYLTKDMFIGFDVKPVTVNYLVNTKKPQPGALGRQAENTTLTFFQQYFFKLGFRLK